MRFWLDRGVDGFRVDVIWLLKKDPQLRDEPLNPEWDGLNPHGRLLHIHTADQAATHQVVRAMRGVLDEYGDRLLLGETNLPEARLMAYYGSALDECQLPINFRLIYTPWQAGAVRAAVERYERLLPPGAWPNWVLGNHDQNRLATRVGPWQLRVTLMLLLTLRGTPTCYYGDELGLENVPIPFSRMKDPQALNQPELAETMCRDPARSPMPWDGSPNAGFCPAGVEPWLPLADDFTSRNVAAQDSRFDSTLAFFRRLTALRQQDPVLMSGDYLGMDPAPAEVFAYLRCSASERRLVVLNFGCGDYRLDLGAWGSAGWILLGTGMDRSGAADLRALVLRPNEGRRLQTG
jgi:alpha-glucosidase